MRVAAERYLPWAVVSPVVSVAGYVLDGVFIGATRTRELMTSMIVSFAIFVGASWPLLALYGNHGLWAAMLLFMAARGVTLARHLPELVRALAGPGAQRATGAGTIAGG